MYPKDERLHLTLAVLLFCKRLEEKMLTLQLVAVQTVGVKDKNVEKLEMKLTGRMLVQNNILGICRYTIYKQ